MIIFVLKLLSAMSRYNDRQRLPLSTDRELKTVSLSLVNSNAKLGIPFLSANQALIGFSGCCRQFLFI